MDPENVFWKIITSQSETAAGRVLLRFAYYPEARRHLDSSIEQQKILAAIDSTNPEPAHELARLYALVGDSYWEPKDAERDPLQANEAYNASRDHWLAYQKIHSTLAPGDQAIFDTVRGRLKSAKD